MKTCKASGGSVYERQMAGEKAGKSIGQSTYEQTMNGEHKSAKKLAIGGVGKQRKNEMTKSGAPKSMPRHRAARGG